MIFFGSKVVQHELPPEQHVCPNCLSVTSHTVTEYDTRFTLYFIPLFSVKRDILFRCEQCGDSHLIPYSEYQAAHTHAEAAGGGPKPERKKKISQAAEAILVGKVVNGKVEELRSPFKLNLSPRAIHFSLWIALIVTVILTTLLLSLLFTITAR